MSENNEPQKEGYIHVSISMLPRDVEFLDRLSQEKRLNRSEFIRQIFGLWLHDQAMKFNAPDAGVYTDKAGNVVHSGLLDDVAKAKVASGEWILKHSF